MESSWSSLKRKQRKAKRRERGQDVRFTLRKIETTHEHTLTSKHVDRIKGAFSLCKAGTRLSDIPSPLKSCPAAVEGFMSSRPHIYASV